MKKELITEEFMDELNAITQKLVKHLKVGVFQKQRRIYELKSIDKLYFELDQDMGLNGHAVLKLFCEVENKKDLLMHFVYSEGLAFGITENKFDKRYYLMGTMYMGKWHSSLMLNGKIFGVLFSSHSIAVLQEIATFMSVEFYVVKQELNKPMIPPTGKYGAN